jgi:uncharacterized protein (DUF58 family)
MDSGYEKQLRIMSRKHDLICCPVSDPRERQLVNAGLVEVEDPETGDLQLVDTASRQMQEAYRAAAQSEIENLEKNFKRIRVDTIGLSTDRPFVDDVRKLFRRRQARAAGR